MRHHVERDQGTPSAAPNVNGKRQMLDRHRHPNGARTNSSPHTIVTPIGPNRLTLPPEHQQPTFSSNRASHSDDYPQNQTLEDQARGDLPETGRPGSRRFIQQYAYMPPQTPQSKSTSTPTLSYAQAAPTRQTMARQVQDYDQPSGRTHITMMPPPMNRDTRGQFQPMRQSPSFAGAPRDQMQRRDTSASAHQQMPPPSTPQLQRSGVQQRGSFRPPPPGTPLPPASTSGPEHRFLPSTPMRTGAGTTGSSSNRFLLQQQQQQQSSEPQRFFSSAQPAGPQRFTTTSSGGGPPTAQSANVTTGRVSRTPSIATTGGQRMPFVPG